MITKLLAGENETYQALQTTTLEEQKKNNLTMKTMKVTILSTCGTQFKIFRSRLDQGINNILRL